MNPPAPYRNMATNWNPGAVGSSGNSLRPAIGMNIQPPYSSFQEPVVSSSMTSPFFVPSIVTTAAAQMPASLSMFPSMSELGISQTTTTMSNWAPRVSTAIQSQNMAAQFHNMTLPHAPLPESRRYPSEIGASQVNGNMNLGMFPPSEAMSSSRHTLVPNNHQSLQNSSSSQDTRQQIGPMVQNIPPNRMDCRLGGNGDQPLGSMNSQPNLPGFPQQMNHSPRLLPQSGFPTSDLQSPPSGMFLSNDISRSGGVPNGIVHGMHHGMSSTSPRAAMEQMLRKSPITQQRAPQSRGPVHNGMMVPPGGGVITENGHSSRSNNSHPRPSNMPQRPDLTSSGNRRMPPTMGMRAPQQNLARMQAMTQGMSNRTSRNGTVPESRGKRPNENHYQPPTKRQAVPSHNDHSANHAGAVSMRPSSNPGASPHGGSMRPSSNPGASPNGSNGASGTSQQNQPPKNGLEKIFEVLSLNIKPNQLERPLLANTVTQWICHRCGLVDGLQHKHNSGHMVLPCRMLPHSQPPYNCESCTGSHYRIFEVFIQHLRMHQTVTSPQSREGQQVILNDDFQPNRQGLGAGGPPSQLRSKPSPASSSNASRNVQPNRPSNAPTKDSSRLPAPLQPRPSTDVIDYSNVLNIVPLDESTGQPLSFTSSSSTSAPKPSQAQNSSVSPRKRGRNDLHVDLTDELNRRSSQSESQRQPTQPPMQTSSVVRPPMPAVPPLVPSTAVCQSQRMHPPAGVIRGNAPVSAPHPDIRQERQTPESATIPQRIVKKKKVPTATLR